VPAVGVDPAVTPALAAPQTVVVNESRASQLQVGLDDTIEVTFADGVGTPLRVVGVAADNALPAELVVGRATARQHDPSALATALPLPAGTAPVNELGARVVDVETYSRQADAEDDRLVWIFTMLLIGVSVGYGALAVANTLFMATARRAPDYRLLRLAGATPRQVLLAIAGESAVVVAVGATLGGAAAVLALWGSTAGLREQTGNPVPMSIPWPTAALAVSTCLLLALAAGVLPARSRLTRFEPIQELS
jgi:putative ABC transport system permease protein